MTHTYARLLRASLFALVVGAGFATIQLIAEDVCGNPLACFEPGQEGEIWQALEPFGETNDQASCTNSLHPDPARIRDLSRQCLYAPHSQLMPPMLGQLMDPFMLAVDGEKIYVSDQSNHRIQAFMFDGTPVPMTYPIGDGVPGAGAYGPYPADSRLTGHNDPITGVRLNSPDGIAVDAAGKLIVGDASGFVNVFNADGSPAFGSLAAPERFEIPHPFGMGTTATGIAITPGTIVRGFGVDPQGDPGRIVVTDRFYSFVFIYDAGFNLIKQIPENIPAGAEAGSACVWDENAPLGTFCTPVMAAIDNAGHIYISEYDNNRIQVLDQDGTPISYFGSSDLAYPWGITLDHLGRLVVADTENQRIAFFKLEYPGGPGQPPVSTFQFELDAAGTLNGYPTAVIEQVGTGPGLDPAGRILVTDTLNNRVQRFQLPDLAIINPVLDLDAGTGSFQVAVPAAKAATVNFVGVSAQGVNATVQTLNGVAPANTAALNPADTALQNATAALGTTIAPGQIATYNFSFVTAGSADVSFIFDAVGNGGATVADPKEASAEAPCTTCVSTHTYYEKPPSGSPTTVATPQNGWFNKQLTMRIDATSGHPSGLSQIAYQFLSGPEASGLRWGGSVHTVNVSGAAASIDVDILSDGISAFRYWAIGGDGTVEASHFVTVKLDLVAPNLSYTLTPGANAAGWNNTAVNGTYTHSDARSGPVFTGVGTFAFTDEGRNQFLEFSATDLAGNVSAPVLTSYTGAGGRTVNIDKTAPVFDTFPTTDVIITATAEGYGIIPGAANFTATATDPPLVDTRPGADLTPSGNVAINNPGAYQFPIGETTWTFTATDAAGNVASAPARKVTVNKAPGTITYTGALAVQYGQPFVMSANVGPAFATGQVTFTIATDAGVLGTISGGHASATIASMLKNVGTYTLTASYPGTASITGASTEVQITVTPAPITVKADDKSKVVGTADPALTSTITAGSLFGADQLTGSLARVAGEMPGAYAIQQGSLAVSSNYALTFVPGTLTIAGLGIDVFADDRSKVYGDADPVLTYSFSPALPLGVTFTGALTREPGEGRGSYTITQGSLALPAGFELYYHSATFSITPRTATVTAGNASKIFGAADPAIPVSSTGFLETDNVAISATRAPGENAGTYSTLAHATGDALNNYTVALQSGTFTITPAVVAVTPRPKSITYGDAEPVFDFDYGPFPAGYSAANVVTPPVCGVAGAHANAGSYTITCSGGTIDNNVVFAITGTAPFTVAQKPVTLVVNNAGRAFGAANPAFTAIAGGLIGADSLNYTLGTTAVANSNVGTYPITATLGTNDNYAVAVTNGTLTIDPATVFVAANPKSKFYGQPNPELDAVVTGEVAGSPVNYSLSTTAVQSSGIGAYPIAVTFGANPNYMVNSTGNTLTVNRLPITVTATAQTMVYGNAEPALTFTQSVPLATGDTFAGALMRAPGTAAGTYAILQGTLSLSGNYDLTYVGANFTISRRDATLTANDAQKFFGAPDPVLTTTPAGFLGTDGVTFSATRASGENVGTYTITPQAAGAALGNYNVTYVNGTFTIVLNNQPPVCSAAKGGEIWPPNHKKFYAAPITGVTDPDGGPLTIVVTGIWQDELIDSTGDGKFSPDGQGVGTPTAWVRAERNGHGNKAKGNGRVYEILFTATDDKGASCSGSVLWTVPHDKGQGATAIDDGVRYDSTGIVPGARNKSQIHQKSPTP